jgi:hypothetical protein
MEGAAMPSIASRIESWGKKEGLSGNLVKILHRAASKHLMVSEIAKSAGCSPQALRYHLQRIGINSLKPKFEDKVKELGYEDVRAFFTDKKNVYKSMKELADLTGFCCPTVSKYYHKFVEEAESIEEK